MAKKANGRALFLDCKLKRERSYGEGIATVFPSDFSTPREALEMLEKVSREWFQVIEVASTSATARTVIPSIAIALEHLIGGVVTGIITGTIPKIEDLCEWGDKDLRDAGQNIVLDAEDIIHKLRGAAPSLGQGGGGAWRQDAMLYGVPTLMSFPSTWTL